MRLLSRIIRVLHDHDTQTERFNTGGVFVSPATSCHFCFALSRTYGCYGSGIGSNGQYRIPVWPESECTQRQRNRARCQRSPDTWLCPCSIVSAFPLWHFSCWISAACSPRNVTKRADVPSNGFLACSLSTFFTLHILTVGPSLCATYVDGNSRFDWDSYILNGPSFVLRVHFRFIQGNLNLPDA